MIVSDSTLLSSQVCVWLVGTPENRRVYRFALHLRTSLSLIHVHLGTSLNRPHLGASASLLTCVKLLGPRIKHKLQDESNRKTCYTGHVLNVMSGKYGDAKAE